MKSDETNRKTVVPPPVRGLDKHEAVSKIAIFDTPPCFCPDGEDAVRMVPDGRSLRVRVTRVDFGQ